ncbi:AMP-binding protein, partial [Klebsiella pneumoniae]
SDLPWHDLVGPSQTLVFYMGLVGLPIICEQLIKHGRAADTPAALIQQGELQVRGPQVMPGYWTRPDATAEVLDAEGWLSTGDIGVVAWDVEVTNQLGELVASYDILTLVVKREV